MSISNRQMLCRSTPGINPETMSATLCCMDANEVHDILTESGINSYSSTKKLHDPTWLDQCVSQGTFWTNQNYKNRIWRLWEKVSEINKEIHDIYEQRKNNQLNEWIEIEIKDPPNCFDRFYKRYPCLLNSMKFVFCTCFLWYSGVDMQKLIKKNQSPKKIEKKIIPQIHQKIEKRLQELKLVREHFYSVLRGLPKLNQAKMKNNGILSSYSTYTHVTPTPSYTIGPMAPSVRIPFNYSIPAGSFRYG